MRTEMKALGALLIAAVLVEPVASASHAAACNTSGVNSAFAAASTCVAGRKSGRPAAPGTSGSSSDTTKFCQYLAVTSVCFGSCACKSVDSCDGNTKGVAPKANQTQQALFDEFCNAWNDNNCVPEKGEFQCGVNQYLVPTTTPAPTPVPTPAPSAAPVSTAPFIYLMMAVCATLLAVNMMELHM